MPLRCYWCWCIPDLINVPGERNALNFTANISNMGSSFVKPKKSNIRREWQKNTDGWWQKCWKPLWSSSHLPNSVSCFVYPLYFHIFMTSTFWVKFTQNVMFTAFQLRTLCSCWRSAWVGSFPAPAHCLPFGRVHKSARMELAGNWDKWFGAELDRSGSAQLRRSYLRVGGCGDPSVWGILQLWLFTSRPRVELREGVWLMRVRLGGNVCVTWRRGEQLGRVEAARAGPGPDADETYQTSRTCSQQHHPPGHSCVCHTESCNQEEALLSACIIQPLKDRGPFSRVYPKTSLSTSGAPLSNVFICTLSLANGRWHWETPRLLSFPHQSLFFFLVWCDVYLIVSGIQWGS